MQLVSTLNTSMKNANSSLHCRYLCQYESIFIYFILFKMHSAQNSSLSLVNFDSLSKLAQCAWNSLKENKDMSEPKVKERVELGREAEFWERWGSV